MDCIDNIGKEATDTITGIIGKISGVYFGAGENPQYKIEFTDRNGVPNALWIAVERAELSEQ